jgi:putative endonuclease
MNFYIYITTNPNKTVLYTGVTHDLEIRMDQHYQNRGDKTTFAGKYFCYKLIYWERFPDINDAIAREKEIKGWRRSKKEDLIKKINPNWDTLDPR